MSALADTESILRDTAARLGPAIVGLGRGWGTGTGVVIAPGQVLTVAHAVERSHRARRHATENGDELTVVFADDTRRAATVSGRDADLDLAVLAVDTADAPVIPIASDAPEPQLGQAVLALANPGGRGLRITHGFVSSTGRSLRGPRGRRITGAIEHTALLPRGSSGAPLLDLEGRLIGLNAVRGPGGLILAVALDGAIAARIGELASGQATERPRLGVALAPARASRELRRAVGLPEREGLLVRGVQEGGPAHRAGVRRGDLLVGLGETDTTSVDDLHAAVGALTAEAGTPLRIVRGTEELTVEVTL